MRSLLFARLLDSGPDAEVADWLIEGFRAWQSGEGFTSLPHALGLPSTPRQVSLEIRNHWLREAADTISEPGSAGRARLLAQAVRRFEGRKWGAWSDFAQAPGHATQLEGMLFLAAKAGEPFPKTIRQYQKILAA